MPKTTGLVSRVRRTLLRLVGGAAVGVLAAALRDVPAAFGARPAKAHTDRVRRSPHFRDGQFHNSGPTRMMPPGTAKETARELVFGKQQRKPGGPVPLRTPASYDQSPDQLHITWYGHASVLVEIGRARVLLDPVWGDRVSPSSLVGPRRLHPVPVPLDQLPPLDAVVISHDHYDHLDLPTIRAIASEHRAVRFVVPLAVGAHLRSWGVPADRITELDWTESIEVAGVRLTATEAQHFSGRGLRRDGTLWTSWVLATEGPNARRVFYTGDSGYFDGYAAIGAEYGPFDATLIQVGAYGPGWPDIHMTPEDGVSAHVDVQGGLLIPVHWGTFNLALHAWTEPVDRVWREAKERDVRLAVPRPGERIDVDDPPAVDGWWQTIG
jgi:L-ascorbate metabolism protein UlaG (beta-lactamase superfamily)